MNDQSAGGALRGETEAGLKGSGVSVSELEVQVERGNLFAHTALGRNYMLLNELEAFVYGVTDLLLLKGILEPQEVTEAVVKVRRELAEKGEVPGPSVALRVDEVGGTASRTVKVNCAERMHVCHGVCCRLDFALSQAEVESGKVRWDMGRPYFIRHGPDGHCVHQNSGTGCCGIYSDRPAACRGYNCATDKRIWKDFEKMELNKEWIAENLTVTPGPRVIGALMQQPTHLPHSPACE